MVAVKIWNNNLWLSYSYCKPASATVQKTITSSPQPGTYMGHTLYTLQRSNVKRLALEGVQFHIFSYDAVAPVITGHNGWRKRPLWDLLGLLGRDADTGRRKMPTRWSAHTGTLCWMCVYARAHTHTNKTAHMHACTHLSVCIQGHIHVDKLFILLRVSHQRFLCKVRYVHRCGVQSLYLEKASSWLPLVPTTSRSGLAQGSGLMNLRQVRW